VRADAARLPGMRALIVDDNATNRRLLEVWLAKWGLAATSVDNGAAALAELRRGAAAASPYALVLLDGCMPTMDGFEVAGAVKASTELRRTALVMLTSSGARQDPQRCRALGVNEFLLKPVSGTDLLDAIIAATDPKRAPAPAVESPNRIGRAADRLRILVAEDHPVNQKYAVRLLEKLGHAAALANDGTEVLALLKDARFDAILMDVQMPNMSGLEATAAIRAREAAEGGHQHIIAMTANAMQGDREACLAGGMDDYVSKPIQVESLVEALDRVARPQRPPGPQAAGPAPGDAEPAAPCPAAFSREVALVKMGGDEDLLREVVTAFLDACEETVGAVEVAVMAGNPAELRRAAHTLKGSVATFSTGPVYETALALERSGRDGSMDGVPQAWQRLQRELAELLPELRAVCAQAALT
jgi:CheY-like chemotaxis protein/HPt (histidine-containing phosphotransfer) domain-containing protein